MRFKHKLFKDLTKQQKDHYINTFIAFTEGKITVDEMVNDTGLYEDEIKERYS